MKKLFKKIIIAIIAITILSCSKDNASSQQTIAQTASANPDLSTLVSALNKTGLTSTLNATGSFTVFAPTNAAFTTFLTANGFANLDAVPVATLRNILLNHVIGAKIKSADIVTGYASTLSPINTSTNAPTISMFIQKSGSVVTLNGGSTNGGAVVTIADIEASNGVVHIVGNVIGIPTLVNHVVANPDFSTLKTVVTSSAQSTVLTALSGLTANTPATLFAPNNTAFTVALGAGGFANGASDSQVTKVLQYHVTTAGNVRSSQLTNNQSIPMFTSPVQNTTVILGTGTVDIKDSANNLCRVFQADIQCSNGVIHGLNRVLQPSL